jgi:mono/diheme cytochrome c family protein
MKKVGKIMLWMFCGLGALLIAGISFTIGWRPFLGPRVRPVTNRTFERTPERLAHGQYLVDSVMGCAFCHSEHDWKQRELAVIPGRKFAGEVFPASGLPGRVVAPNITPDPDTGIGSWTDDEIARAIREGVDRDGRTLFPLMPYEHYRDMSDEDLASVIVYLRAQTPVRNVLPKTQIVFPVRYLIRSVPQPVTTPVPAPDASTAVSRGAYLVEMGGCADCHTPQKRGQPIKGMEFGGGFVLDGPWGRVASPNITPDPSGISYYDAGLFVQTMRTGSVKAMALNAIMPWPNYGTLPEQDLTDIFAYLKTLKPVAHRVDNSETPTLCRVCGSVHGLGDKN